MKFVDNIEEKEYENFLLNFKIKNHFLQSTMWGKVKKSSTLVPKYVGVTQNGELIACALLLQKKLPMGYSYFYSPRGPVLDYSNDSILEFFIKSLKIYIKKNKGIFLKIDPDINVEEKKIFSNLLNLGFKHKGFNLNFENSQPRFTFRIDINKSYEDVYNKFDKSVKKSLSRSTRYVSNIYKGTISDIDKFNYVMKLTEKRKSFYSHNSNYYEKFMNTFKNNCGLFIATIDINESIKKLKNIKGNLEKSLSNITGQGKKSDNKRNEYNVQIADLNKDIDKLKDLGKVYPNIVPVSAYIISYYSNKAWALYGGNVGDFMFTNINYLLYEYHIKYAMERHIEIYDLFGSTSPKSSNKHLLGLYDFKRKFGGDLVEFIGEFDLITNKTMYILFTKLVPIYRKIVNHRLKKK